MGFTRPSFALTWADGPYAGLEVSVRPATMRQSLDAMKKQDGANDEETALEILRLVASLISSWNLEEDDGTPVPVSFESLLEQDAPMVQAIVARWFEHVQQTTVVPPPLPNGSGSGQASQEARLQIPVTTKESPGS